MMPRDAGNRERGETMLENTPGFYMRECILRWEGLRCAERTGADVADLLSALWEEVWRVFYAIHPELV